ncbi:MAG: hypothetical protein ACKVZH_07005 [Blastocatellia bacterium]
MELPLTTKLAGMIRENNENKHGNFIAYSLAPMLSVRNGARAVEFYKSAFGAIEVYRMEDLGGAVVAQPSAGVVALADHLKSRRQG